MKKNEKLVCQTNELFLFIKERVHCLWNKTGQSKNQFAEITFF